MDSRRLMFAILAVLLVVGLALSLVEALRSGDWLGSLLNLGPEIVGAVLTYVLFDQFIERRERTEAEKERLIEDLGSSVNDVAKAAADVLRRRGWLEDGSLRDAYLVEASLQGASLWDADLQGVPLSWANLQQADLGSVNLRGAFLAETDLREADLRHACVVDADLRGAVLPDGTQWTPDTDLARFTDPDHPDFWRSDDPKSPAYRGKAGD